MDSQEEKSAEREEKQPGARSTVAFPYSDLDSSVELVRGVHTAGGTACDTDQLAAELKMEPKGGGFRLRITSAQTFGLINYERGGRVSLTDTGRRVLDDSTERSAKIEAFLNVPLYKLVFEQFRGSPLPPQAGLERAIEKHGVGPKVKDRARQVMLRSAKQAGFFDASSDRLVKPAVRESTAREAESHQEGERQNRGGSGGSGGGGGEGNGDQHPLIRGLLITLPQPGDAWSVKDRLNWLTMANSIFKSIYTRHAGDAEGERDVRLALEDAD